MKILISISISYITVTTLTVIYIIIINRTIFYKYFPFKLLTIVEKIFTIFACFNLSRILIQNGFPTYLIGIVITITRKIIKYLFKKINK